MVKFSSFFVRVEILVKKEPRERSPNAIFTTWHECFSVDVPQSESDSIEGDGKANKWLDRTDTARVNVKMISWKYDQSRYGKREDKRFGIVN